MSILQPSKRSERLPPYTNTYWIFLKNNFREEVNFGEMRGIFKNGGKKRAKPKLSK